VNGHSWTELSRAIEDALNEKKAPVLIMAHTIKGKGVDFMEDDVRWHYGGLDSDTLAKAKQFVANSISE
jgi:transketolase